MHETALLTDEDIQFSGGYILAALQDGLGWEQIATDPPLPGHGAPEACKRLYQTARSRFGKEEFPLPTHLRALRPSLQELLAWTRRIHQGTPVEQIVRESMLTRRTLLNSIQSARKAHPDAFRQIDATESHHARKRRQNAAQALKWAFLNQYGLGAGQIARLSGVSVPTVLRRYNQARQEQPALGLPPWKNHSRPIPREKIEAMQAMRDQGATWQAIAGQFGYANGATVLNAVTRARKRQERQKRQNKQ